MNDFSEEIITLAENVRKYAGDILGHCRTTEEVRVMGWERN